MKWSLKLGKISGIDVYLHLTTLILFGWIGVSYYSMRRDLGDAVSGVVFVAALFAVIVLHELGHALAARRYGIQTRDITLLPIGGVARLERMPEDPKQELIVALAGPAVNVVLAALLFFLIVPYAFIKPLVGFETAGGDFFLRLFWINVGLAVFNMIPAFPMDGGRVLRAFLAMRMEYVRATGLAASIGQTLALVFGFLGLVWNPFLLFIALFVWMGAASEAGMVQVRSALSGIPLRRVMMTGFQTLAPSDPLARAIEHVLAGFQQDFPVVGSNGVITGILTRSDLIKGLAQRGPESPVAESMRRDFQTADPSEMGDHVFARLQECQCRTLPVVQSGKLIGLVTAENVGEFMMIQAALRGEADARLPAEARMSA
jgi:Zn-dependent protease